MRVGVIEIGADGVRLLVATAQGRSVVPLREERAILGLPGARAGGGGTAVPVAATAELVDAYARVAREFAVAFLQVLVTRPAPTNAPELVRALEAASSAPVRVLSEEDEARLIWEGALSAAAAVPETVAVCDVGAEATTVVVGTVPGGPAWVRSLDVGAARLTERFFDGRPEDDAIAAARAAVELHLNRMIAPLPKAALATPVDESTLPGAAVILAELEARLGVRFETVYGGLREGAALALLAEVAAA